MMTSDPTLYRHFRFDHADGRAKDWAIGHAEHGGVRIRYGATGQTMRLTDIAREQCRGDVGQEIERRVQEKTAKGYVEIGVARVVKGRLVEDGREAPAETALHWEVASPIERTRLLAELEAIGRRLGTDLPGTTVTWQPELGLDVSHWGVEWHVGYQAGGGFGAGDRGGGKIVATQGPVAVLVMMALERAFPDAFRFADHRGELVEPRIARDNPYLRSKLIDFERVREIGARLELCLARIQLGAGSETEQSRPIWF